MLGAYIIHTVKACCRRPWLTLLTGFVVAMASGAYAVKHFAINTNTDDLISTQLEWRRNQITFDQAFPNLHQTIVVVMDAATPEAVQLAAERLQTALSERTDVIHNVERLDGLEFFRRNALLFLPIDQVQRSIGGALASRPFLASLAVDPSLRGLANTMAQIALGAQSGAIRLDDISPFLNNFGEATSRLGDGETVAFSWRSLLDGAAPSKRDLKRYMIVSPVLDFSALEPGAMASEAIRSAAKYLELADGGVRVRLTGDVALADEEFATVADGALVNNVATVLLVAFLLWAALKSTRIVLAILLSVSVGLLVTAALGLMMVGALNLISVAFAVLFVGIGADFGIQFSVRYRAERHRLDNLNEALVAAAARAGRPLALAAAATACGFLAFLPTVYRGVSELGLIAGVGMIVAFIASITVLPAALMILKPPGEPEEIGYAFLAPVDAFLSRRRWHIICGTLAVVLAGTPLLARLRFDFNPLNLRSDKVESVSTLREMMRSEDSVFNNISALAPSIEAAGPLAEKLAALPEVRHVMDLESFIPRDQDAKLAIIRQADPLKRSLAQAPAPTPSDAQIVRSLQNAATVIMQTTGPQIGRGAEALKSIGAAFTSLAKASQERRVAASDALITPLMVTLRNLKGSLEATGINLDDTPPELRSQWIASDGRARIEISPKGDANDNDVLRGFTRSVLTVAPNAAGAPIAIQGAGDTILRAFLEAGAWALLSISILLFLVLRRVSDVLLTLAPLVLAGIVTLELCVLIDMPLNFANIIALPLLLGLGVAFKIYFVMAWRAGVMNLLQSSLRAPSFSARSPAPRRLAAFGSRAIPAHQAWASYWRCHWCARLQRRFCFNRP
jgi:hopanoid biosynthesis associated RND transporter like protein HpnN